jgi:hypothetical protein
MAISGVSALNAPSPSVVSQVAANNPSPTSSAATPSAGLHGRKKHHLPGQPVTQTAAPAGQPGAQVNKTA